MKLDFLPAAREEFYEAALYYEEKEPGLGKRFRQEVWQICKSILDHPFLWREQPGGFRRVNCSVFPLSHHFLCSRGNCRDRSGCSCEQAAGLLEEANGIK